MSLDAPMQIRLLERKKNAMDFSDVWGITHCNADNQPVIKSAETRLAS